MSFSTGEQIPQQSQKCKQNLTPSLPTFLLYIFVVMTSIEWIGNDALNYPQKSEVQWRQKVLRVRKSYRLQETPLFFAEMSFKKYKQDEAGNGDYLDICLVLPTSCICAPLFCKWKWKYALTDYRKSISPTVCEAQMILYVNWKLWGISHVNNIVA